MKKKSILVGAGALLLMASMNLGHAVSGYGFLSGNLCGSILAQTTTTGSGSTSTGGGGSTGGSSSTGTGGSSTGGISDGYLKESTEVNIKTGYHEYDKPVYSDDDTIIGKVRFGETSYKVRCDPGSSKCYFNKTWSEREIISSATMK